MLIRPAETNPTSPDIFQTKHFSEVFVRIYCLGKVEEWESPSLSDLGENLKSEKMLLSGVTEKRCAESCACPRPTHELAHSSTSLSYPTVIRQSREVLQAPTIPQVSHQVKSTHSSSFPKPGNPLGNPLKFTHSSTVSREHPHGQFTHSSTSPHK